MSWDPVWEKVFRNRASWGKYPPEELVRFFAWNFYGAADRARIRVLELGCGPGGGPSWYIAREGFSYAGIDGAPSGIMKAKQRFKDEGLAGELILGDFCHLPWADETFDCVIDVASLQCNDEKATREIIREMRRVMKTGAWHFSLTAKNGCWGDKKGPGIDATSLKEVTAGPYIGLGITRFATKESLQELYADFKDLQFEYSIRTVNNCKYEISNWIVTCRK